MIRSAFPQGTSIHHGPYPFPGPSASEELLLTAVFRRRTASERVHRYVSHPPDRRRRRAPHRSPARPAVSEKKRKHISNGRPPRRCTERHRKLHGKRLDAEERARKKAAREGHKQSENAQNLRGLRAKLYAKQRHAQKIQMRKAIKQHEERNVRGAPAEKEPSAPVPAYLLDRANPTTAKALSSQIKNKRAEKAARFSVPIPKVKGISEEEMFKVYVFPVGSLVRGLEERANKAQAGCANWGR